MTRTHAAPVNLYSVIGLYKIPVLKNISVYIPARNIRGVYAGAGVRGRAAPVRPLDYSSRPAFPGRRGETPPVFTSGLYAGARIAGGGRRRRGGAAGGGPAGRAIGAGRRATPPGAGGHAVPSPAGGV